jgi:hypothetical protein
VNKDELERRLRSPRRLEGEYAEYRDRPKRVAADRQTFQPRVTLAGMSLFLLLLAGLLTLRFGGAIFGVGAGPQASGSWIGPEPSKPWVSVTPTATPPLSLAVCAPGNLSASLDGWGAAGGTTYAAIRLTLLVPAACRLPAVPVVSILDSSGAVLVSNDQGTGRWVPIRSSLIARVGLSSLCGQSPARPLAVSLDFGRANRITVGLPSDFGAPCNGGASQITVDELFAP